MITESGMIVGVEFSDLVKLNPDIEEENLATALIFQCNMVNLVFGTDEDGEYVSGSVSVDNPIYNEENLIPDFSKYLCIDVEWNNNFVHEKFKDKE